VCEFLVQAEAGDPAVEESEAGAPRPRFGDLAAARQDEVADRAALAIQALVAATKAPSRATTKKALLKLFPERGRRAADATLPSEEESWNAINTLLKEVALGNEDAASLARNMRLYRDKQAPEHDVPVAERSVSE
jgi:hypothetical protein